jgi:arylsulfatase A-like enzyme
MSELTRRQFIKSATAFGTACIMGLPKANAKTADRPNIILLMSDDQGWGETSYNGHPHLKTPVLDEMASSGLRLDRFYAASPVCSPTRVSCMTGRHANRSGAFGAGWSTRPEEITVAQILKEAGYRTAHYGKWHIGAVKKGSPTSPNSMGFDECFSHDNFFEMNWELSRNGGPPESFEGDGSEVIVDEALKFARKIVKEGKPFFIVIWFGSPHDPYSGYEKDVAPFKELGDEIARRFAEITAMDRAIGTLRRGLDELNVRQNTLLWFNSDNGVTIEGIPIDQRQHLYNGGLKGHKSQLYEGGVLVPGIIEWPRIITSPRSSSIPCVTSDILPTLIDIVGVPYPRPERPIDGISLKPLIVDGPMDKRPRPIGFWGYNNRPERKNEPWLDDVSLNEMITLTARQKARQQKSRNSSKPAFSNHKHPEIIPENFETNAAWVTDRYKLYMPRAKKRGKQVPELYDLVNDRQETTNIASKHPEVIKTMLAELRAWQRSVETSLTGADYR